MSVSFEGVGQVCATFLGSGLTEGQVVKMTGQGKVGPCGDGDDFCGAALCCREDACTVQVRGFVTVGYSGDAAPGPGFTALCANGTGGVRAAGESGGRAYLVAATDAAAKTATILL